MPEQPIRAPADTSEAPTPPPAFRPHPGADQEIEAKFAVADPAVMETLATLDSLAPNTHLSPGADVHLITDTYYDTPDFAFLRAGFSLRIRRAQQTDADAGAPDVPAEIVTIKSVQSLPRATSIPPIHQRFEVEGEISPKKKATQLAAWPRAVRKKAKGIAGSRPALHPILLLTQHRTKRWAYPSASNVDPDAPAPPPLAELSLDTVTILDPAGGEDTPMGELGEVELELQSAQEFDLARFGEMVKTLQAQAHLTPVGNSKLTQGLMWISAHAAYDSTPTQGVQASQAMAEAGRVVWRHELMKMLLCEAGVRAGEDIEYVHDMRVATRRSRAALTVFGPYFQKSALDDYAKGLRKTARRLGRVRDLDVILDNLDQYLVGKSTKQRNQAQPLVDRWMAERIKAQTKLVKWLDSADYHQFIAEFQAFCLHPQAGARNYAQPPGQPPVPHQVRHILPSAIWRHYEAVRAYEGLFDPDHAEIDAEAIPSETLHQLRIDIKALRYNLDFVQHLLGRDGMELLKQLKKLQNHLGDLNDAVVKAARLSAMQQAGLDTPFVAQYIDVQIEIADRLRRRFPALWSQFNRPETRSRLGRALARI